MEKTIPLADFQSPNPQTAIRCDKAEILLSQLKHSLTTSQTPEENEQVERLRTELVRERVKNKKMKVCSVMDLFMQILMLLLLCTLCFLILAEFSY